MAGERKEIVGERSLSQFSLRGEDGQFTKCLCTSVELDVTNVIEKVRLWVSTGEQN